MEPLGTYKRGTVGPIGASEYLDLGVSPALQSFAGSVVDGIINGAVAMIDRRWEALDRARAQRKKEIAVHQAASLIARHYRAWAKRTKPARQRKEALRRVIATIEKRKKQTMRQAFDALKKNAHAQRAAAAKQRAEKVALLHKQFTELTGVYTCMMLPQDLSNVRSVHDLPKVQHMLPPKECLLPEQLALLGE